MSQIRLSDINKNSVVKIRLSVWMKSKYSQGNSTIPAAYFLPILMFEIHKLIVQASRMLTCAKTTDLDSKVHGTLCVLR